MVVNELPADVITLLTILSVLYMKFEAFLKFIAGVLFQKTL